MPSECLVDRAAMMMGYAGCYSSFLKHAEGHADKYGVKVADILLEAGARKLVGGQEDQTHRHRPRTEEEAGRRRRTLTRWTDPV